ncbi:MAG TPA: YdeI/OmpD-associated family protein [Pedobacter sp.]|jgi:hypothetical protein
MEQQPLIHQQLLLERFPGKGGWTYAKLPDIPEGKLTTFGFHKVRGIIDGYEVNPISIMPMGKGVSFIAVKAEIRKVIKKNAGDWVEVVLYSLQNSLPLPEDFQLCLEDEPDALKHFQKLSDEIKKQYLDWIYSVKSEEVIIERMSIAINKLAARIPLFSTK